MPDDNNATTRENAGAGNAPPIPPVEPTTHPTDDGPNHHQQRWWHQPPNWGHILHAVTILVGLGVAWIYLEQWNEMHKQTLLLGEQANRTVIENIGNAATTGHQLKLLQRQTRAAQTSVETIQKQFREDQRPYLWVASWRYDSNGKNIPHIKTLSRADINTPVTVGIDLENYGRSPAKVVRAYYGTEIGKDALKRVRKLDWIPTLGTTIIPPRCWNEIQFYVRRHTLYSKDLARDSC